MISVEVRTNLREYILEIDKQLHHLTHYEIECNEWYDTIEIILCYLNVLNYVAVKERRFDIDHEIRSIYSLLRSDNLNNVIIGIEELEKQILKWCEVI